jgi:hypothetical protein
MLVEFAIFKGNTCWNAGGQAMKRVKLFGIVLIKTRRYIFDDLCHYKIRNKEERFDP